jgi:hypothetical protein
MGMFLYVAANMVFIKGPFPFKYSKSGGRFQIRFDIVPVVEAHSKVSLIPPTRYCHNSPTVQTSKVRLNSATSF